MTTTTTTTREAIQCLVDQLIGIAREQDHVLPEVGQIDFVPGDDGRSIVVFAHLANEALNGGLPLFTSFDIDSLVRDEFEIALFAARAFHNSMFSELRQKGLPV